MNENRETLAPPLALVSEYLPLIEKLLINLVGSRQSRGMFVPFTFPNTHPGDEDPGSQNRNFAKRCNPAFLLTASHTFTFGQWFKRLQWLPVTTRIGPRFLTWSSLPGSSHFSLAQALGIPTKFLCIQYHLLTICKYPNSFLFFQCCHLAYFFQIHLKPALQDYIKDPHNLTPHQKSLPKALADLCSSSIWQLHSLQTLTAHFSLVCLDLDLVSQKLSIPMTERKSTVQMLYTGTLYELLVGLLASLSSLSCSQGNGNIVPEEHLADLSFQTATLRAWSFSSELSRKPLCFFYLLPIPCSSPVSPSSPSFLLPLRLESV